MTESHKTNEKLQKFVDEFYASGDNSKGKDSTDAGGKPAILLKWGGPVGCTITIVALLGLLFLLCTACNLV